MLNSFKNILLNKQLILLFDGAMGTMLLTKSKKVKCNEELNIAAAKVIINIHKKYLLAGADVIETNTFGANYAKLKIYDLEKKIYEINFSAVANVKKAIEEFKIQNSKFKILGSIGPSGKILKPYGDTTIKQMQKYFREQIKGLIDGGVDGFIIETMLDIEEAKCILEEIKRQSTLPVIISITFSKAKNKFYTLMGKTPEQCAKILTKLKIAALGTNCGLGIDDIIKIIKIYRDNTNLPLLAQPNAGNPKVKDKKIIYPQSPLYFANKTKSLIKAGANLIGGCCGTTPTYIKVIKNAIKNK